MSSGEGWVQKKKDFVGISECKYAFCLVKLSKIEFLSLYRSIKDYFKKTLIVGIFTKNSSKGPKKLVKFVLYNNNGQLNSFKV